MYLASYLLSLFLSRGDIIQEALATLFLWDLKLN